MWALRATIQTDILQKFVQHLFSGGGEKLILD
jgi:hypothetical protein